MTDNKSVSTPTVMATTSAQASPKKAKSKKPRVKPTHPRTAEMVNAAIMTLKDRGGSSLQAIKKYISTNYKIDAEKHSPFIKKYLKAAVAAGGLVQTKGKGAAGSFRMPGSKVDLGKAKKKPVTRSAPIKKAPLKKKLPPVKKTQALRKAPATPEKRKAVGKAVAGKVKPKAPAVKKTIVKAKAKKPAKKAVTKKK